MNRWTLTKGTQRSQNHHAQADPKPRFTEDGYEMSMGVNHLGHFLLTQLLMSDLEKAKNARCIIVGSITGNSNTIGGGLVYPRADLGDLSGLKQGPGAEMADGKPFFGAKAYKDSKVCNMMTVQEMHRRFHDKTGITFSSLYPGCIAETCVEINQCVGCTNSSRSHFSAMTLPSWLGRAAKNRHRHAIEQATRRWRGG